MKCPDPCEKWELRDPESIIERLLARSARSAAPAPKKETKPSKRQKPEQRSYHYVMAANHFRHSPKAEIRIKAPNERRKAALAAAANDPMLKARKPI